MFKRSLKFRLVPSGPDRGKYAKSTQLDADERSLNFEAGSEKLVHGP
jgi:hypothetical protein